MEKQRKRNTVAKELIGNPLFRHKMEKSYKQRRNQQNEEEFETELREYKKNNNGKTKIQE